MVAESSAMGAMNNGGIPPHNDMIPYANPDNQDNENDSNHRNKGNPNVIRRQNFPNGRFKNNGKEYCPITKKPITKQGRCKEHFSAPCVEDSSPASTMEVKQK